MPRPKGIAETKPRQAYGKRLSKAEMMARITRLQANGVLGDSARNVLDALGGDEYMLRLIGKLEAEGEWTKVWDVTQFLLQMRDGRPAQRINITATQVHVSAAEVAHAAQVVKELMAGRTDGERHQLVTGEDKAKHNVFEGEGVKRDG